MKAELLARLKKEDRIEQQQRLTGKNINNMHLDYQSSVIPKIPNSNFFTKSPIFINKHQRFSETPAHTHSFIEFNYVLTGSCQQTINGKTITLKENQLVLLDKEAIQHIGYMDQEDLMINLLLQDTVLRTELSEVFLGGNNWLANFFTNVLEGTNTNQFLIFDLAENEAAQLILLLLAQKSFTASNGYQRSLNYLTSALLVELTNCHPLNQVVTTSASNELLQILKFMNDHYQEITLQDLATEFGYNKNYLSNLLKAKTGITFQMMLDQKRLMEGQRLLKETDLSLNEIAERLGYKSPPSLFKLFHNALNMTPTDYRNFIR